MNWQYSLLGQSLGKGTEGICPQVGKVTNPVCCFHRRLEVTNGPAGERQWNSALLDDTGIDVVFLTLGSRTWGPKGDSGLWCWGLWGRILHFFGFPKILVPFNQIWMTNRANIPSAYYPPSLKCLWICKLALAYSQVVENLYEDQFLVFFQWGHLICISTGKLRENREFNCQWCLHFWVKKPIFLTLILNSVNGKSYFSSWHILSIKFLSFCSIAKAHQLKAVFINVIYPTWVQSGIWIKLKQKVILLPEKTFLFIPSTNKPQIKGGYAGYSYNCYE